MPRKRATKPGKKATGPEPAVYVSFPANALVPGAHGKSIGTAATNVPAIVARKANLLADRQLIAGRPALMERQIVSAPRVEREPEPIPEPVAPVGERALPLPSVDEPLVVDAAPLPRGRALVAPPRGLFERVARWLGKPKRGARPAASAAEATERPDVALLRAELRELRAQLAVARRMAERREELVRTGAL